MVQGTAAVAVIPESSQAWTVHPLVRVADLAGTFVFGFQGALLALTARLDLFVVLVLSFATALGGGVIRDVLMGALPPDRPQGELVTSVSLSDVADATTVIEAVIEVPETKAKVLAEASAAVRPGTTLISNTSCIPIDEMASSVARADELVGVHFMNPAYMITMVEVIRGPRTGDATMTAVAPTLVAMSQVSSSDRLLAAPVLMRVPHSRIARMHPGRRPSAHLPPSGPAGASRLRSSARWPASRGR